MNSKPEGTTVRTIPKGEGRSRTTQTGNVWNSLTGQYDIIKIFCPNPIYSYILGLLYGYIMDFTDKKDRKMSNNIEVMLKIFGSFAFDELITAEEDASRFADFQGQMKAKYNIDLRRDMKAKHGIDI